MWDNTGNTAITGTMAAGTREVQRVRRVGSSEEVWRFEEQLTRAVAGEKNGRYGKTEAGTTEDRDQPGIEYDGG